jgi:hypothetical protein
MNMLIEFVMFLFMLPAIGLYALFSLARSVVEFFGGCFYPGVLGLYLGGVLLVFGQPDPRVEWETIFQTLAGVKIAGVALPAILIGTGAAFLGLGAVLRLKGRRHTSS